MKKTELRELEKKVENTNRWAGTHEDFFNVTVMEACGYMLGGYENAITDNAMTLQQANDNFYKNMEEAVKKIHEYIRHELDQKYWGARFKGNRIIVEIIIACIKYNLDAVLVDMNGNDIKDIETLDGLEMNQVRFDFKNCWAL